MSKLAFFFMTLVGAVPAGGALYALIRNLLDRADSLGTVLLAITITATVCTAMVVFYKDERDPAEVQAQKESAAAASTDDKKVEEADGFGDVIPDDFDEDELAASSDDDDGEFDDDAAAFDDDEFGDYEEEYEEFDEDEEL